MRREYLRILHVLAPAPFGGLETVVQLLVAGQAARRHDVAAALLIDGEAHPYAQVLRDAGASVTPIVARGRDYRAQRAAFATVIRAMRPDVVHSHGYLPDILQLGVARAHGVPTVSTLHGFTGTDWKLRLYERLQCRAVRRASATVAVSRGIAERVRRAGVPPARLHLIPNAFASPTPPLDRAAARARLGLDPEGTYVGWIGRLSAEKGPDVMLDAFAQIASSGVRLSFVGDGADRAALERRARELRVSDRVHLHGVVPEAGSLVRAFDVLALSSRTEGTPMTILEAMAAGTPIVATRVGGVPDVLTERDALLVPPEQPDALAGAIAAALDDRAAARERAASARTRLDSAYGVEPWLSRYEQLYSHIISHSHSP